MPCIVFYMDIMCADELHVKKVGLTVHDRLTQTDFTTEYKNSENSPTAPQGENVMSVRLADFKVH